jgi:hypothetical protein
VSADTGTIIGPSHAGKTGIGEASEPPGLPTTSLQNHPYLKALAREAAMALGLTA